MLRTMDECYKAQVVEVAVRQALADAQREAEMERATYLVVDDTALAA